MRERTQAHGGGGTAGRNHATWSVRIYPGLSQCYYILILEISSSCDPFSLLPQNATPPPRFPVSPSVHPTRHPSWPRDDNTCVATPHPLHLRPIARRAMRACGLHLIPLVVPVRPGAALCCTTWSKSCIFGGAPPFLGIYVTGPAVNADATRSSRFTRSLRLYRSCVVSLSSADRAAHACNGSARNLPGWLTAICAPHEVAPPPSTSSLPPFSTPPAAGTLNMRSGPYLARSAMGAHRAHAAQDGRIANAPRAYAITSLAICHVPPSHALCPCLASSPVAVSAPHGPPPIRTPPAAHAAPPTSNPSPISTQREPLFTHVRFSLPLYCAHRLTCPAPRTTRLLRASIPSPPPHIPPHLPCPPPATRRRLRAPNTRLLGRKHPRAKRRRMSRLVTLFLIRVRVLRMRYSSHPRPLPVTSRLSLPRAAVQHICAPARFYQPGLTLSARRAGCSADDTAHPGVSHTQRAMGVQYALSAFQVPFAPRSAGSVPRRVSDAPYAPLHAGVAGAAFWHGLDTAQHISGREDNPHAAMRGMCRGSLSLRFKRRGAGAWVLHAIGTHRWLRISRRRPGGAGYASALRGTAPARCALEMQRGSLDVGPRDAT
ncbi:hypothetical protein HYPSUDRAFT_203643 [Hypholoma sublateritium FD-334 SS-4]|uniref:Uncharacterized protein n=1 Tax=Hypholoma sublateritium (strain FD-334 SS-4) TaxID=945553 RepID=A0A0D2MBA5_HYPSF|nr:hypothetical protein HYPSUDRAFT_203643 [Hypholoma sublateritium FD-334 SS-4]